MNEGLIPRRYAKALYGFALEKGQAERMYELMRNVANAFSSAPSLQEALGNPFISSADKQSLLLTASGDGAGDECILDFMKLLAENHRLNLAHGIALAYIDLYRKERKIYVVNVVSASELKPSEEKRLKDIIMTHLDGGTMEYTGSVDHELLGGFVVNINNERFDASISNELKQLRLKLLSK